MLTLTYKDYCADVDFDWIAFCWVGRVLNVGGERELRGATVEEAERDFRRTIDAFLNGREDVELEAED